MAIDKTDGAFPTKTRDQIRDDYIRDYQTRVPSADGSEGSHLWAEASAFADAEILNAYVASRVADAVARKTSSTEDLDALGAELDCPRLGDSKSTGYVSVVVRTGGALCIAGTTLKTRNGSSRFQTTVTGTYTSSTPLAIQALVAGTSGNLDAGTELIFESTPAGFNTSTTVFQNTDGTGLSGGAPAETNEQYNKRLDSVIANPPQAGNEAAVVKAIESIKGVGIEKGFAYPAIRGPGSMGIAFTMRPAAPGASRLPNGATIALVEQHVKDAFPGDDSILAAEGIEHPIRVSLKVTWAPAAVGWVDYAPWPSFSAVGPVLVDGGAAISASAFRVHSDDPFTAPTVGKSFGLYNSTTRLFVRKTILTVTEIAPGETYDLTFDTSTPGLSDLAFVPAAGAILSPWSESLNEVVAPILAYGDAQGPGEMVNVFGDPGKRERRYPPPDPTHWPSKFESRVTDDIHDLSVISDAVVVEPEVPAATNVGTPGATFHLHRVTDIGVFVQ